MTEVHIEDCPHCGEKPVFNGHMTPGSPAGPPEYTEEIYCNNPGCTPHECLESWNTRVNKEAKLLEELKIFITEELKVPPSGDYESGFDYGLETVLRKIEQFEAEQKVVSDE